MIMTPECHKVRMLELNENMLITLMVMMHGEGDYDAKEYDYDCYIMMMEHPSSSC